VSDLNSVSLSGRLTRDPELRTTGGGTSVLDLRVAFGTSRKNGNEWVEESNYVDVVFFGKRAEFFAERLTKGSLVFVGGKLRYEEWEAQDGSGKRNRLKIMGDDLKSTDLFNGAARAGGSSTTGASDFAPTSGAVVGDDDDIPF
jgi:single-strand DNA-binding protein